MYENLPTPANGRGERVRERDYKQQVSRNFACFLSVLTAMLFQAGEACILEAWRRRRKAGVWLKVLEAWRLHQSFMSVQKATLGRGSRRPKASSVL